MTLSEVILKRSMYASKAGIGITTPASPVHVNGGGANSPVVTLTNTDHPVGERGMRVAFDNSRLTVQRASDSGTFQANYVSINQNNGRVGINQITPQADVHLNGRLCFGNSNGIQMSISNDFGTNNFLTIASGIQGIRFVNAANTLTHFWMENGSGNLGIGTISPSSKLEVFGDLTLTSTSTTTAAVAGTRVLPSNPVDFLVVKINGNTRGIPFYEV